MKKLFAVLALAVMLASCVSTTPAQQDDGKLNDAQMLEKHDLFVPWWHRGN